MTKLLSLKQLNIGAEILRQGGLVAFPTETVYGLGANALNETAVKNIFKAKMEIIKGMTKGKLIINSDNKYLKKVKKIKNIEVIKCGIKKGDLYASRNY